MPLDSHDTKRPVQQMVANGRRAEYVKGFIYEILDLDKSSSKELGCCVGKVKKMFLEARLDESRTQSLWMKSSPAPRFLEVGDVNHAFLYLCVHCLHVISQTPSQSFALKPPVYNTKTGNSS